MQQDLPAEWVERARSLAVNRRAILGLAGTPGSGKSTLAGALAAALGPMAALAPMDGFHLANAELARLGRADRKGAPDTFDVAGYGAMLDRLRRADETVYAPEFRRAIEEAVAGALPIAPPVRLVITEGNYLLHDDGGWEAIRSRIDEVWFVEIDAGERIERLVRRHRQFGRSGQEARDWVLRSDEANAALIERARGRADFIVRWPPSLANPGGSAQKKL